MKLDEPVPLALQAIVNRATSKDPADRYPSVTGFSDDLRRYVHGEEVHARPDNFVRGLWRRVQRHPVAVMSALLIALSTAAAVTTFSLYRGLEAERIASSRGQTLATLVATVNQKVNEFDTLLFQVEGLLEGVAASSREQLENAVSTPYQFYLTSDLKGDKPPKDLANIPRYQHSLLCWRQKLRSMPSKISCFNWAGSGMYFEMLCFAVRAAMQVISQKTKRMRFSLKARPSIGLILHLRMGC